MGVLSPPTEGDVSDVVAHGGVRVLELQRWLPVAEQHLGGRVAGSPALLELLQRRSGERARLKHYGTWIFLTRPGPPRPAHLHEDFADDDVVVVFEDRAEDHRHSVLLGLHVPEGVSGEREGEEGCYQRAGRYQTERRRVVFCTRAHMDSSSR